MLFLYLSLKEAQSSFEGLVSVLTVDSIVFEPVCMKPQIIFSDRMRGDLFPNVDKKPQFVTSILKSVRSSVADLANADSRHLLSHPSCLG